MTIDLNCDLGEGEPAAHTRAIMRWITSANVACGGHAGDENSMRDCVRLTQEFGVHLGAHPGPNSRSDKGRGRVDLTTSELEMLLIEQVETLQNIASAEGARMHHVKLHGSLYHAVERDAGLAAAYVRCVAERWPGTRIIARSGGCVVRLADEQKVPVWREAFADRAYEDNGELVPRDEPGAVLHDVHEIVARVERLKNGGRITTRRGNLLDIQCDTVCVHSDSPNALPVVQKLSHILTGR